MLVLPCGVDNAQGISITLSHRLAFRLYRLYARTRQLLHDQSLPSTIAWCAEEHESLLAWVWRALGALLLRL
jgi:hypothetical protein